MKIKNGQRFEIIQEFEGFPKKTPALEGLCDVCLVQAHKAGRPLIGARKAATTHHSKEE